jgi:hypothetical protein
MRTPQNLSPHELKNLLDYDPNTGIFLWKKTSPRGGQKKGKKAGKVISLGYVHIRIKGKNYMAHHIAWFFMTGDWPQIPIGHENKKNTDNRFENLYEKW